jgi:hypothetical protein
MPIPIRDVVTYSFSFEINQVAAMEKYYSWEVKNYGRASDATQWLRHHWLLMLLKRQLREFDREI